MCKQYPLAFLVPRLSSPPSSCSDHLLSKAVNDVATAGTVAAAAARTELAGKVRPCIRLGRRGPFQLAAFSRRRCARLPSSPARLFTPRLPPLSSRYQAGRTPRDLGRGGIPDAEQDLPLPKYDCVAGACSAPFTVAMRAVRSQSSRSASVASFLPPLVSRVTLASCRG